MEYLLLDASPAAEIGEDAQECVGLGLALPAQDGGGVVPHLKAGDLLGVVEEPHDYRSVGDAVLEADRTGHVDDSIDQFGPRTGRHRLVACVERGLVQPLSLDERRKRRHRVVTAHDSLGERGERIHHRMAIGHGSTISSLRHCNHTVPS